MFVVTGVLLWPMHFMLWRGLYSNSIEMLSTIFVSNRDPLPQAVVDSKTASSFQRWLQKAVKLGVKRGLADWEGFVRNGVRSMSVEAYQSWFDASAHVNVAG